MVLAARYGNLRDILEVMVATVPVLFLVVVARGQGHATTAIASTLLGVYWIGLAVTHGELLRQLPHGKGVVIDVLLGTFIGDTARLRGWPPVRPPPAGAPDLAPQDLGGAGGAGCWGRSSPCSWPAPSSPG